MREPVTTISSTVGACAAWGAGVCAFAADVIAATMSAAVLTELNAIDRVPAMPNEDARMAPRLRKSIAPPPRIGTAPAAPATAAPHPSQDRKRASNFALAVTQSYACLNRIVPEKCFPARVLRVRHKLS